MEVFIKFGPNEESFDAPQFYTKEFGNEIRDKFGIKSFDLYDEESRNIIDMGQELISRYYSVKLTKKDHAINELKKIGVNICEESLNNSDLSTIIHLIDTGIKPCWKDVENAIISNDYEKYKILIGSQSYTKIKSPMYVGNFLDAAISVLNPKIVSDLCFRGINVNNGYLLNGENHLHTISKYSETPESLEITKILCSYKINIEKINFDKRTPLFLAVMSKNHSIVEELCKRGAKVNISDIYKHTPLYYAEVNKDIKSCQILKKYGAI